MGNQVKNNNKEVINPSPIIFSEMKNFFTNNKWILIVIVFFTMLCFNFEISNFTLSIDEEREIVQGSTTGTWKLENWIKEGRFGIYILKKFFTIDGVFTPGLASLVASILLAISAGIWCLNIHKTIKKVSRFSLVAFIGMYLSMPFVVAEYMSYSIFNIEVNFAMVLMAISIYYLIKYKEEKVKIHIVFSGLCFMGCISIYQAFIPMFITATCLINLNSIIISEKVDFKEWILDIRDYVIAFVVGLGSYYIINMIFRLVYPSNGYTGTFIAWNSGESFREILIQLISRTCEIFFNLEIPGIKSLICTIIAFFVYIAYLVIKNNGIKRWLILFMSICLIISPMSLSIVLGNRLPIRTMLAIMLMAGGIWFIIIQYNFEFKWIKLLSIFMALILIWNQVQDLNRLFYGDYLCYQLDQEMGHQIAQDILNINNGEIPDKPIIFVGRYVHAAPNIIRVDAIGQSFFGRPRNIYKLLFLDYLGYHFKYPTIQQEELAQKYAEMMPKWPAKESIQEFEDFIIIRLK